MIGTHRQRSGRRRARVQRCTSIGISAILLLAVLGIPAGDRTASVAGISPPPQVTRMRAVTPVPMTARRHAPGDSITAGRLNGSVPDSQPLRTLFAARALSGSPRVPETLLEAYRAAAARLATEQPACHLDWTLLAGIGRIESNHARGGYVDSDGYVREAILGPVLDGSGDTAAVPDTDDGELDGDAEWDRAVGPMQFIPATWRRHASDGSGDGSADPRNVHDATLTAGRYLCAGGMDLAVPDQLRRAVFRYNNSSSYVSRVLLWAARYRGDVQPGSDSDIPLAVPLTHTVRRAQSPSDVPTADGRSEASLDGGDSSSGETSRGRGDSGPTDATSTTSTRSTTSTQSSPVETTTDPSSETPTGSAEPTTTEPTTEPTSTEPSASPSSTTSCSSPPAPTTTTRGAESPESNSASPTTPRPPAEREEC